MIHAAIGAVPALDSDALEFVIANRMAAAKAFRVLRDARTLTVEADAEFAVRAPEGGLLGRFAHPGAWAVTLEPQVAVVDATGAWLSGDRRLAQGAAPLLALFERRPQINVLARARTPHLAAWAATGRDFSFEYAGRTHVLRNVATNDVEFGDSAGLLRRDGQVSVWSTGELTDAAELIAVAEQAAQILSLTQAFATIAR